MRHFGLGRVYPELVEGLAQRENRSPSEVEGTITDARSPKPDARSPMPDARSPIDLSQEE